MNNIPRIAIVDPNTLAVLGLTNLLESVMPMLQIDSFGSFAELQANHPEQYFHYFVDVRVVLNNMSFFQQMRHKTIVLSSSAADDMAALSSFHTICTNLPPKLLLRSLLMLEQHAHANGRNLPPVQSADTNSVTPPTNYILVCRRLSLIARISWPNLTFTVCLLLRYMPLCTGM